MTSSQQNLQTLILRITCFCVFAGRAWQHLFWDAPFRTLLWDQDLMEDAIQWLLGTTWQTYVTSPGTDAFIQGLTRGFGFFYLGMALLTLVINKQQKITAVLYLLSSLSLGFLAFLYCKEKFYHGGQFFEYAIQIASPLLFFWVLSLKDKAVWKFSLTIKVMIALTFAAHGLYAVGFYPRPGVFLDMVINILGVSEPTAHDLLRVAGIMDFVVAIGLFVPRVSVYCMAYCVVWGFATALARTWANVDLGPLWGSLFHQYLPQTIYRLSHGFLPLAGLLPQVKFSRFNRLEAQRASFSCPNARGFSGGLSCPLPTASVR